MTKELFAIILVSSFIYFITSGYLLTITTRQYHFFIEKKKHDVALQGKNLTLFESFSIVWIYSALALNFAVYILCIVLVILIIEEY